MKMAKLMLCAAVPCCRNECARLQFEYSLKCADCCLFQQFLASWPTACIKTSSLEISTIQLAIQPAAQPARQGDHSMSEDHYKKKRNFSSTPEPAGGERPGNQQPLFVIQEHAASSHHFDFRLEVDGALKSWAVPKGPSTDPRDKRLAIPTEDHPLAYADFEGVIPEGQYGAGTVIVWDRGKYDNITKKDGQKAALSKALERGHALVFLHGKKLRGGYALKRIRGRKNNGSEQWLLVKMDDSEADARRNPVSTEPDSVISGRSLDEVSVDEGGDDNNNDNDKNEGESNDCNAHCCRHRLVVVNLLSDCLDSNERAQLKDEHLPGKVEIGFDKSMLERLTKKMDRRRRKTCPFADCDNIDTTGVT